MRCVGRLLTFDDWNRELLASYKRFRAEQGVSINTIAKDVKVLKLWLKEAYVRQLHDNRAHMEAYFNPSQYDKIRFISGFLLFAVLLTLGVSRC